MARFTCCACGGTGEVDYDPDRHECPLCRSRDVIFTMAAEELPDLLAALGDAIARCADSDDGESA